AQRTMLGSKGRDKAQTRDARLDPGQALRRAEMGGGGGGGGNGEAGTGGGNGEAGTGGRGWGTGARLGAGERPGCAEGNKRREDLPPAPGPAPPSPQHCARPRPSRPYRSGARSPPRPAAQLPTPPRAPPTQAFFPWLGAEARPGAESGCVARAVRVCSCSGSPARSAVLIPAAGPRCARPSAPPGKRAPRAANAARNATLTAGSGPASTVMAAPARPPITQSRDCPLGAPPLGRLPERSALPHEGRGAA
ncbi:hypothetical protein P7K49_033164, partial [Saguinus oedipus]